MDLDEKLACGYELMSGTKERLDTPCLYNKLGTFKARYPGMMQWSQAIQLTMRSYHCVLSISSHSNLPSNKSFCP